MKKILKDKPQVSFTNLKFMIEKIKKFRHKLFFDESASSNS